MLEHHIWHYVFFFSVHSVHCTGYLFRHVDMLLCIWFIFPTTRWSSGSRLSWALVVVRFHLLRTLIHLCDLSLSLRLSLFQLCILFIWNALHIFFLLTCVFYFTWVVFYVHSSTIPTFFLCYLFTCITIS